MKKLEEMIEGVLWNSRLIVIFAVIASLAVSIAVFFMATVDAYYMISHLSEYVSSELSTSARGSLRAETITHVVEIVDGYLLATVLLIFSLGLYELFISKINQAEHAEGASNVLLIKDLDDLKSRLAKVILMILIVKYFEHASTMHFGSPLDLLYLAAGVLMIGGAIYVTHAADNK